ncbi:MAG: ester cyclase [Solirubrobacterales bacterium]|nr:ester cyclase [Solirubrobacterales bacterium]
MSSHATIRGDQAATSAPSASTAAEASRRLVEETFNHGNLAIIDQLVAPQFVDHDPGQPARLRSLRGPAVLRETVQMYRAAFPDVQMTVDEVIAQGDKVALRWHGEGTHRGPLEGMAPTGTRGTVTGIFMQQWKDGQLIESWGEWDNLGLARQLGAAPPEGSVGEKIGMAVQRLMARRMRSKNRA